MPSSALSFSSALVSLLLAVALTPVTKISATAATKPSFLGHHLFPRQEEPTPQPQPQEVCSDLTVSSNNGDRKVVIVIDSSGSMADNDPSDLRLIAARALNDFLISNSEAGGGKADQVSVVGFDYSPYTVFGPGDPGNSSADLAISEIGAFGGTYIAGGVLQALDEISQMPGDTKERSAIVVFTDGSDSDTPTLVDAIKNATSQGIRVSFGFLDLSSSYQPEEVLLAVRESKGLYATITLAAGTRNFVNYVILNGLTYQDNPQGAGDRLLSGLGTTQVIDGSNAVTLKYLATQGERANFTLVSITGDSLSIEAKMNGQTLNRSEAETFSDTVIEIEPPSNGEVEVIVTAQNNPVKGLFSVVTNSNQPIKNCTVGVSGGGGGGLSTGAKAGLGVGLTALLLGLAGGGFWAYKHFGAPTFGSGGAPAGANTTAGPVGPTGAEKMGAHTNVFPVDPSHMNGMAPTGGELGPNHTMLPPDGTASTGQALTGGGGGGVVGGGGGGAGAGAQGFAPLGSGPAPPTMGMPPTGGVPPAAVAGLGSVPSVFVPPLVPPNVFGAKPGGSGSKPGTPNPDGLSTQHTNFNVPPHDSTGVQNHTSYQDPNAKHFLSNGDGAQQPLGGHSGFQGALPDGGGAGGGGGGGGANTYMYHPHTGMAPTPGTETTGISYMPSPGDTTVSHTLSSPSSNIGSYGIEPTGGQVQPTSYGIDPSGGAGTGADLNHTNWNHAGGVDQNHTGFDPSGGGTGGENHTNFGGQGNLPQGGHAETGNYSYSIPQQPPVAPGGPGVGGYNNPGFTMPGAQVRMGFGVSTGDGRQEEKHHHHPWLAPDSACEQPECPLNLASHQCSVDAAGRCECTCVDANCPYLRRRV